jgi:putative addiction module killer protein
MGYHLESTNIFDRWFARVKDVEFRARIVSRFDHIRMGHFGDYKVLGGGLFELRFFFGSGFRIYNTIKAERVVLLLCGGKKSTQGRDIEMARKIMKEME